MSSHLELALLVASGRINLGQLEFQVETDMRAHIAAGDGDAMTEPSFVFQVWVLGNVNSMQLVQLVLSQVILQASVNEIERMW